MGAVGAERMGSREQCGGRESGCEARKGDPSNEEERHRACTSEHEESHGLNRDDQGSVMEAGRLLGLCQKLLPRAG